MYAYSVKPKDGRLRLANLNVSYYSLHNAIYSLTAKLSLDNEIIISHTLETLGSKLLSTCCDCLKFKMASSDLLI